MRLWRWVVPVRGSPAITIGAAISTSWISGWRASRSVSSSRFTSRPVIMPPADTRPMGERPASVSRAARSTSMRSTKSIGPKSSRPVWARGRGHQGVAVQLDVGGHAPDGVDDRPGVGRELRVGEVGEAHGLGAGAGVGHDVPLVRPSPRRAGAHRRRRTRPRVPPCGQAAVAGPPGGTGRPALLASMGRCAVPVHLHPLPAAPGVSPLEGARSGPRSRVRHPP